MRRGRRLREVWGMWGYMGCIVWMVSLWWMLAWRVEGRLMKGYACDCDGGINRLRWLRGFFGSSLCLEKVPGGITSIILLSIAN